jgi:hypothetical protein
MLSRCCQHDVVRKGRGQYLRVVVSSLTESRVRAERSVNGVEKSVHEAVGIGILEVVIVVVDTEYIDNLETVSQCERQHFLSIELA